MVTPFTIARLADENEIKELHPVLGFGADCYEAGMIEVLKELAERELMNLPPIKLSELTNGYQGKVDLHYLLLKNALTPQQIKLLEEYSDQFEFLNGSAASDYFIAGFLHGYRYLKSEAANRNTY